MGVAIESTGSGDPLLFIHGLGGSTNVFGPQVAVLSRFFTCHRFDLPGAGRSETVPVEGIGALVAATIAVLDGLGVDRPVHLVAHSMGTVIAQHLAVVAPDRVRSLALIGPIHAPAEGARTALRARAATARAEGLAGIADQVVAGGTSAETKAARPEVAAFVRELILRQDPEGYARHCDALAGAEAADVAKIAVPALLATGDEDNTSPSPAVAELAARFADARLEIVGRAGHWLTFEKPRQTTELILNFLFQAAAGAGR
jgi:pimeloyl-ACP methyl ester carboxylesterase